MTYLHVCRRRCTLILFACYGFEFSIGNPCRSYTARGESQSRPFRGARGFAVFPRQCTRGFAVSPCQRAWGSRDSRHRIRRLCNASLEQMDVSSRRTSRQMRTQVARGICTLVVSGTLRFRLHAHTLTSRSEPVSVVYVSWRILRESTDFITVSVSMRSGAVLSFAVSSYVQF